MKENGLVSENYRLTLLKYISRSQATGLSALLCDPGDVVIEWIYHIWQEDLELKKIVEVEAEMICENTFVTNSIAEYVRSSTDLLVIRNISQASSETQRKVAEFYKAAPADLRKKFLMTDPDESFVKNYNQLTLLRVVKNQLTLPEMVEDLIEKKSLVILRKDAAMDDIKTFERKNKKGSGLSSKPVSLLQTIRMALKNL